MHSWLANSATQEKTHSTARRMRAQAHPFTAIQMTEGKVTKVNESPVMTSMYGLTRSRNLADRFLQSVIRHCTVRHKHKRLYRTPLCLSHSIDIDADTKILTHDTHQPTNKCLSSPYSPQQCSSKDGPQAYVYHNLDYYSGC